MRVSKPTVFFSHASRDAEVVQRVQQFVAARTGRAVELFVSSDGQSIPGGQNWSARLHDALAAAQLMFVFVSPRSLDSRWIYFEAGYVYRAEIAVVPLGILGVALDRIPAPLNILQGFEIRSPDGLGNLIDRVNRTFDFDFPTAVTDAEYEGVFAGAGEAERPELEAVRDVVVELRAPGASPDSALAPAIAAALGDHGIDAVARTADRVYGQGFAIGFGYEQCVVTADPDVWERLAPAVPAVAAVAGVPPGAAVDVSFRFPRERVVDTTPLRESLLLGRLGVTTVGERTFEHLGTTFSLGERGRASVEGAWRDVTITMPVVAVPTAPVLRLVRALWDAGLLTRRA